MCKKRLLFSLLFLGLSFQLVAQDVRQELEKERVAMYRYYNTDSVDLFMTATERLMKLALETGDEKVFYTTWSNRAMYLFRKVSREQGLAMAKELREYADKHDSKYGFYSATSISGTMLSSMGQNVLAEKHYLESVEYIHRYFPEESAAASLIGLAKICDNKHDYQKMIQYAEQALAEPNLNPIHRQAALGYICIAIGHQQNGPDDVARFNKAYEEWAAQQKQTQTNGGLMGVVRYYHEKVNGRYAEALKEAQKIDSKANRLAYTSEAYALLGDYKNAYNIVREYKRFSDSVNTVSVRKQASEYADQLGVARAENEAKDLRITNQRQLLVMLAVIALLVIVFLTIYLLRRRQQIKQLKTAYDQLEETTTAKERIESELRIARDIQMAMVPSTFPPFPERNDIDLYATMLPARAVGGDFYDFFLLGDRLYFCVGDVAGKGVPASMTMAVMVNLFRTIAKEGVLPTGIATRLNDALASNNENATFVTAFIGMIDLCSGRLDFCNAGHNPPIIINAQHSDYMPIESNVVIGLWPDYEFVGEHIDDIRHKPLLVYTDGVNEAENKLHEQFGEDRLLEIVKENRFENARRMVELVQSEIGKHVSGADSSDDKTLLCIHIS